MEFEVRIETKNVKNVCIWENHQIQAENCEEVKNIVTEIYLHPASNEVKRIVYIRMGTKYIFGPEW